MSTPRTAEPPPGTLRTSYAGWAALELVPAGAHDPHPVVLVPGYTGSKEDFLDLLGPLAAHGLRVIALDQPGQMDTPGLGDPERYRVDRLAAQLADVLTAVLATVPPAGRDGAGPPVGRPGVHLVGHSFGGLVARATVLSEPRLVASLTLLASGPGALGGTRGAGLSMIGPLLDDHGVSGLAALTEAGWDADPRMAGVGEPVRALLRRRMAASDPAALRGMAQALLDEPDRCAELAASPLAAAGAVLVAHGDGDDAWSPAEQKDMAARLGARYVVIDGAAHSPAAEAPQATADALAGLVRALGSSGAREAGRAGPAGR